jgi:uncharacterized protein YbbK (DUF523 family)
VEAKVRAIDPILVSACLLGLPTRYDGQGCASPGLLGLVVRGLLVPICPEMAGGLPVPRPPAECIGGDGEAVLEGLARVRTAQGEDVTAALVAGAGRALDVARRWGIRRALLKENSPSCASHRVYDGSFRGRLVAGQGVTAALLRRHGIEVLSEEEWGILRER